MHCIQLVAGIFVNLRNVRVDLHDKTDSQILTVLSI